MNASARIREAAASDMGAVNALLSAAGLAPVGAADAPGAYFVADDGGALIGAIGLERYGRSGLLRSAAVAVAARNTGVGRLLVGAVVARARDQSLTELVLLTTTAEEWFRGLGFAVVDRSSLSSEILGSSQIQGGCPSSAVVMRMQL